MRRIVIVCSLLAACNHVPDDPGLSIGPAAPRTADDLVLTIDQAAVDRDDDPITNTVVWEVDGNEVADLADPLTVPADRTAKGQVWTATVVSADDKKQTEPKSTSVTITNTPPVVEVLLTPPGPTTSNDVTARATSSDDDGDPVEVVITWLKDGQETGLTGETLPRSQTARGETWTARAIGNDGTEDGPAGEASITILNEAPSVLAAKVDPTVAYEASELTCKGAGWKDSDGDPETYETTWFVQGRRVSTDTMLTGALFDKGDQVACEIAPTDGIDDGPSVLSANITVRNTPPRVATVTVTPDAPRIGDRIKVEGVSFTDDDGDFAVAKYEWFLFADDLERSSSFLDVSAETFAKGDEISVGVRGFDGQDTASGFWTKLTVANTPPSAPGVDFASTPSADAPLLCDVVADSTDPDVGDAIDYFFVWSINGTAVASTSLDTTVYTNDTLKAGNAAVGDVVACEVTADDGEDVGAAGTVTETVP